MKKYIYKVMRVAGEKAITVDDFRTENPAEMKERFLRSFGEQVSDAVIFIEDGMYDKKTHEHTEKTYFTKAGYNWIVVQTELAWND